jgi:DNA-binding helix-hairpin-helix protein with protein kinase domain
MRFVHNCGFAFGHLKASDILFEKSYRIQIMDIVPNRAESHCRENLDESARRANGSPSEFAAPEVLFGAESTRKADVFAFASILFSIVVGHHPFGEAIDRRGRAERPSIFSGPGFVPDFVSQLIRFGLSTDPDDRPSFDEIIAILKRYRFNIAEEVDPEVVSAFVRSVE